MSERKDIGPSKLCSVSDTWMIIREANSVLIEKVVALAHYTELDPQSGEELYFVTVDFYGISDYRVVSCAQSADGPILYQRDKPTDKQAVDAWVSFKSKELHGRIPLSNEPTTGAYTD